MSKFCAHCGKEIHDEAVVCVGCGCPTGTGNGFNSDKLDGLLRQLSSKINTNAIIWLVIGIIQVLGGLFTSIFVTVVGVVNIINSITDMNYSKEVLKGPKGIVARYESLTGPIITLVYNILIGGLIGVIGSIYYFVAIRSFVMENKAEFITLDA